MTTAAAAAPPPQPLTRRFHGCSKIGEYEMLCKLGEGTFGEVHKARQIRTGNIVALKKILMHNEKDGFPITALREIKLLKMLCHDNVLKLEEMAVQRLKGEGKRRAILYMVTPYMDHDLSGLLDNPDVHFSEPQIKCYMLQLLKGLRYLHDNHILHRDMKAANLLINNRGRLQIADFGLARHYDEPVPQRGKGNGTAQRDYTTLVVTRWYRPPELLLQLRRYTPAIDMWGAGCVFGEMFKRKPILAGNTDINQAQIIFQLMGSPNNENMPGWDSLPGHEIVKNFAPQAGNLNQVFRELGPSAISLLSELLKLDWRKRINAIDAIDHPYFKQDPKPMREEDIPHFQESHELDRRNARGNKQALPPAPAGGTVGMGPNGEWTGSGPPPNGVPWTNGDRRGWPPQDRGPPGVGVPPGQTHRGYDRRGPYDHRAPPPPPRQPNWGGAADHGRNHALPYDGHRHSTLPPPPGEGRHPLPPPPPGPHQHRGPGPDRGQDRAGHRDTGDVYIPNYDRGHRPPMNRHSRDPEDRPRRGSRDSANSQDRYVDERAERNRGYRDRDGPPPRDGRDYGRDRRTRSRSPDRRDRGQHNIYRR